MKAVFLCESCGKSVSYNAHRCPFCGRFFTAVVCPECNYTGMPKEFLGGCPQCGYLTKGIETMGRKMSKGFILSKKKKSVIEFPLWFYKVVAVAVALLLVSIIIWYISSIL